ncbi:hypothetical protein AAY473_015744 [Plecturocebus cupreus]
MAPFFFFSFFTSESTAFSAHFSSSSPCFQPSSRFTAGLVKEKRELMGVVECIRGHGRLWRAGEPHSPSRPSGQRAALQGWHRDQFTRSSGSSGDQFKLGIQIGFHQVGQDGLDLLTLPGDSRQRSHTGRQRDSFGWRGSFAGAPAWRFPVRSIRDGRARLVPSPQGKQQLEALRTESFTASTANPGRSSSEGKGHPPKEN